MIGDMPCPTGEAATALGIPAAWPAASETQLDNLAEEQSRLAQRYEKDAQSFNDKMVEFNESLQGEAGDKRQQSLVRVRDWSYAVSDHYKARYTAAKGWQAAVYGLKASLTGTAEDAQRYWDQNITNAKSEAVREAAMSALLTTYQPGVASATAEALADFEAVPEVPPPPPPPVDGADAKAVEKDQAGTEREAKASVQAVDYRGEHETDNLREDNLHTLDSQIPTETADSPRSIEGTESDTGDLSDTVRSVDGERGTTDSLTDTGDRLRSIDGEAVPPERTPSMPMAPGSLLQGGAPSMPGNPAQSLGGAAGSMKPPQIPSSALNPSSAFNPASSGASSSLNAPTSPATSNPLQSFTAPLSDTAGSFQSGLSSGLGSSAVSGVGPRAVDPAMLSSPPAAVTGQPVAAAQAPGVVGPAGPPAPTPPAAGPMGGGMPMGGGGMIPPAAGAAPLGPYTPPGGTPPPAGTPAATTAAAGPSAAPAASTPGSAQGGTTAAPLVGSTTGAAAAMADQETNPDLATATQVLEGLVRGTNAAPDLVHAEWAVAVTRTAMGPITVIASSVGGGAYLPSSVYVPMGVRVAPLDSSLPMGWAAQFMGWQHPVDVVIAHAQTMAKTVAGVRVSAIATTDGFGPRPKDGADFAAVTVREILGRPGSAPAFDGGHLHRLATVDPSLAQRVAALDRGGDMTTAVAADMSVAVIRAAQEHTRPDGVGLVHDDDVKALLAIKDRKPVDWDQHFQDVAARDNHAIVMPEAAAKPVDLDDAEVSVAIRARYTGFYIAGRIVELVRCWRQSPPSILDIAYCGLMAGAGGAVAGVVGVWEREGQPA